ncbi:hypothetical protein DPEC_G00343560 [Dallia pectoralis]|uniref:Uncharacterized protein n=1 Tax=Dallia pectoralis TaxID=75939 RepID=A0ACC2F307_DALPE|nr:hypothetical protein DPEC_G00343560 [Dallia pectoralis]
MNRGFLKSTHHSESESKAAEGCPQRLSFLSVIEEESGEESGKAIGAEYVRFHLSPSTPMPCWHRQGCLCPNGRRTKGFWEHTYTTKLAHLSWKTRARAACYSPATPWEQFERMLHTLALSHLDAHLHMGNGNRMSWRGNEEKRGGAGWRLM